MISIISFIKNEIDIIDRFIKYHINICDKLILIDNGSTDGTLEHIQKYKDGVILHSCPGSFELKSSVISQLIIESDQNLLIPLDADEILAYENHNGTISLDKAFIKEYLHRLAIQNMVGKFKVKNIYNYIPNTNNWFDTSDTSKMFFLKNDFISTDAGFHNGITKSEKTIYTDIVYLHFHYRNKEAWLKSSKQKLQARLGDKWNDLNTLLEYKKPRPSSHIALEYSNYILTDKWHNLKPKKHIDIGNL